MNALLLFGSGLVIGAAIFGTGWGLANRVSRLLSLLVDALQPSYPQVLDTSEPRTFRIVVRFQDRRS